MVARLADDDRVSAGYGGVVGAGRNQSIVAGCGGHLAEAPMNIFQVVHVGGDVDSWVLMVVSALTWELMVVCCSAITVSG